MKHTITDSLLFNTSDAVCIKRVFAHEGTMADADGVDSATFSGWEAVKTSVVATFLLDILYSLSRGGR